MPIVERKFCWIGPLAGFLLVLSGAALTRLPGPYSGISLLLLGGAGLLFAAAVPALHFAFLKPFETLRREMEGISNAWFLEKTTGNGLSGMIPMLQALRGEVDRALLRGKELEATVKVYAIEKEQMEAVLRSLPIAVFVTNRFNELILSNEVAQSLFDFNGETVQGKPLEEALRWDRLVNLIKEISNRKVKVPRRRVELTYEEEGETRDLMVVLSSITDHTQQILGVVTIVQDITKEREIDRMKSEFVANVSHELKSPLSSIKAYSEMLIDGEAEDKGSRREFCAIIEREADRLSAMIESLLDLSRLEAGVIQMERERVNLISMLKSVEESMRPNAEKKRIALAFDVSQYIVPVLGDRGQLNRVFVNLLSNAVKYTPEGGKVDVTARLEGDLVRVDIADTGYGIPEDALPHIFQKFYRVKETKDRVQGTGMGLAMVKRILEIHNAEIKVKSRLGEGSCFSVFLASAD